MKRLFASALLGLLTLSACSTLGMPRFDNDADCDTIMDTKERLDCYEKARQETAQATSKS